MDLWSQDTCISRVVFTGAAVWTCGHMIDASVMLCLQEQLCGLVVT